MKQFKFTITAIFICIVLAVLASFLASSFPDGLERIAANLGLEGQAKTYVLSPISDYSWWSGVVGVGLSFVVAMLLGRFVIARSGTTKQSPLK